MLARRRRPRRAAVLLLALTAIGLTGCATPSSPRYEFAELTYRHLPPIRLDVAIVDVVDQYRPPMRTPNVEHLFPVAPAAAAAQWARDRLAAAGATGAASFVILQASAVEVPLERTTGIKGIFTEDQSERYDVVIEVRLDLQDGGGASAGSPRSGGVRARAQRSTTVAEDISPEERRKVWYELTDAAMTDLNAALERNIREHLGPYLR